MRSAPLVLLLTCLCLAAARAEPLAPRSTPAGNTMFTLLPPAATGVVAENRYADPRIWTERYHEFAIGAIGTGVAIADYDGDGRPDIFVVSKTETCRLFRNLGGWKFEDITARAGLLQAGEAAREWKQGAAFADVNNDGRPDLYVCRHAAPNLLYINQGDGTFREEAAARGLALNDASGMGAFCDYDRDGWLDVLVQTNILDGGAHPSGQRDRLFHNDGEGRFTEVTDRAGLRGEAQGHSATWWDYDEDGWPDLYVANDFLVPDVLWRNHGDGTFTNVIDQVVPVMPYHSMGADTGDFDGDGRLDLFVADMARTTSTRERATIADSRARSRVATPPGAAPQVMRNTLYLATGTGRCLEAAWLTGLAATDWTWSVRAEDLDNDGRVDVHVTNGMVRDYDSVDLRARTMAAESSVERVRLMRESPPLADRHLAYRNLGDLRFEDTGAAWGLDQRGVSFGAAFGDLDGDGDLDLVYANYQAGVTLLRNDSQDGHRLVVALRGTRSNRFGIGAIVRLETAAGTQVRSLTLARGYLSTSEPLVHFGLGEEDKATRLTVEWPSGVVQTLTDVAADQRLTLTEPDGPVAVKAAPVAARYVEVGASAGLAIRVPEPPREDAEEQPLVSRRFDRSGPVGVAGDLDGDGRDDVVLGGSALAPARWMRQGPAGRWLEGGTFPRADVSALGDGPVAIFDANGDGTNDVLITRAGTAALAGSAVYQPELWLNDGPGRFHPAANALPALPISMGAVVAADFDHDGRMDLFLGGRVEPGEYPRPPRSALLLNRGGRFEEVTTAWAAGLARVGLVTAALGGDVDGDGWADLMIATEWGGISYWHNEQGRGFADRSGAAGFAAAGTGAWTALAAGDFNGDGRPDFVAGNLGLNTPYRASPEEPALIYYGDFGERAGPVAIEAQVEAGRIIPRPTRRQLGALWPSVLRRFPRNDLFARTTLAEVVGGADKVAAAERWAATELQSGVFLSEPAGTWRFSPLPRIAQLSPLTGLVAGDFDGDGKADIYAVQNSGAPLQRVGRFAGGLSQLLAGDGRGGFTAVPPAVSGLVVPGEVTGVIRLDVDADGTLEFLVTRTDATTLVFCSRGR